MSWQAGNMPQRARPQQWLPGEPVDRLEWEGDGLEVAQGASRPDRFARQGSSTFAGRPVSRSSQFVGKRERRLAEREGFVHLRAFALRRISSYRRSHPAEARDCITRERRRMAEREGFEPPCRLPGKTLSRRPRYDHFGTSPLFDSAEREAAAQARRDLKNSCITARHSVSSTPPVAARR
jgi:hypothetical protein